MTRVYSHSNSLIVFNLKNLLEHHGIACVVKNDGLNSASGEVPPTEVWPELWIENETRLTQAQELIDIAIKGDAKATTWFCYNCKETNEPAFEICWNCAEEKP